MDFVFQFALPRGERHFCGLLSLYTARVSIRAPARGATVISIVFNVGTQVSIRAPARGATPISNMAIPADTVSIRAPARGATHSKPNPHPYNRSFNSRSREGSDDVIAWWTSGGRGFNSRSREGSDVFYAATPWRNVCFNSRSREGSDCHHRMAGTVWLKPASCASLPERYRMINGNSYAIQKIILPFMLLALSLISRYFAES